ncbi:hypothetical protein EMCRGX_G010295 [Ephydatia muelleri]
MCNVVHQVKNASHFTSPAFCQFKELGATAGASLEAAELRRPTASDAKGTELGWVSIPLVVESYEAWGKEAPQF